MSTVFHCVSTLGHVEVLRSAMCGVASISLPSPSVLAKRHMAWTRERETETGTERERERERRRSGEEAKAQKEACSSTKLFVDVIICSAFFFFSHVFDPPRFPIHPRMRVLECEPDEGKSVRERERPINPLGGRFYKCLLNH